MRWKLVRTRTRKAEEPKKRNETTVERICLWILSLPVLIVSSFPIDQVVSFPKEPRMATSVTVPISASNSVVGREVVSVVWSFTTVLLSQRSEQEKELYSESKERGKTKSRFWLTEYQYPASTGNDTNYRIETLYTWDVADRQCTDCTVAMQQRAIRDFITF